MPVCDDAIQMRWRHSRPRSLRVPCVMWRLDTTKRIACCVDTETVFHGSFWHGPAGADILICVEDRCSLDRPRAVNGDANKRINYDWAKAIVQPAVALFSG